MRFFQDLRGYSLSCFRADVLSALSVAFLVIPQATAYALLAGLPFQSGLYSAVFGSLIVGLFSHSKTLISGPSTAMAVLVQIAVVQGTSGEFSSFSVTEVLSELLLLIGAFHLFFSLCNVSKFLQFVSRSVMLGYFSGLSVVIVVEQLYHFFQVPKAPQMHSVLEKSLDLFWKAPDLSVPTLFLGSSGLLFLFYARKKYPNLPAALFLMIVSSFFVYALSPVYQLPILEKYAPSSFSIQWHYPSLYIPLIQQLLPSAFAIALLGVLEAFSVAKALSSKTRQKLQCNQEVFALSLANFFLSIFSFAMPASASITRSLLAHNTGAKSRISVITSSLIIYLILLFFWPFAKFVPIVALSSLLIFSTFSIVDRKALTLCFRATKEDACIFLVTFFFCMIFRLDMAFLVGVLFSIGFYLRSAAIPHFQEYAFDYAGRLSIIRPSEHKHSKVRIIGIGGELFFGMVDVLENAISDIAKDEEVKVVVLRLNNVHHVDGSMCLAIVQLHEHLLETGRHLMISGITTKVWNIFGKARVLEKMEQENFFLRDETRPQLSTWKACLRAEELLSKKRTV